MITIPPPAPQVPKRTHGVRNLLLIIGGFIVACGLFSMITNPDAVKDGFKDGYSDKTVDYKHAVTTIPVEDLPTAYAGYPAWVNDESIAWSEEVGDLLSDTSDKLSGFDDAANDGDVAKATDISVDVYLLWLNAPDAPEGMPITNEYNAMRSSLISTFDKVSDIMLAGSYDRLNGLTSEIAETVRLMGVFTSATDDLTAELEALD